MEVRSTRERRRRPRSDNIRYFSARRQNGTLPYFELRPPTAFLGTRRDLKQITSTQPRSFLIMSNIFEAGSTEERGENARLRYGPVNRETTAAKFTDDQQRIRWSYRHWRPGQVDTGSQGTGQGELLLLIWQLKTFTDSESVRSSKAHPRARSW